MATITQTVVGSGVKTPTVETLTLADDFEFRPGARQLIELANDTGGPVVVTLVGDEAGTVNVPCLALEVDASTGYDITIPNGETRVVNPESISCYLKDSANKPAINSDVAGVAIVIYQL